MKEVDISNNQFIVLDDFNTSSIHFNASIIAISSVILLSSSFVLIDHILPILPKLAILFIVQIISGMILIRLFYYFGRKARLEITLIDPSSLNSGWVRTTQKMNSAEMAHIFEKMQISLSKSESKIDDLTDLSLFIVVVWSVISTAFIYPNFYPPLFYYVGGLLFLIICYLSYLNGYRSFVGVDFDEELSNLEYYVLSRVSAIEQIANVEPYIIWLVKNGYRVLYDVGADIDVKRQFKLSYYCGIPSSDYERIHLEYFSMLTITLDQVSTICSKFQNILSNWDMHIEDGGNGLNVMFYNKTHPVQYQAGKIPITGRIISKDEVRRFSKGLIELINCCNSLQNKR